MAAFSSELKAAWLIGELWYVCTFSWQHGGVTHKQENINALHFHVTMRAWQLWFDQSTGLSASNWWISSSEFPNIHVRFIHLLLHDKMTPHWHLCVWFWVFLSFFNRVWKINTAWRHVESWYQCLLIRPCTGQTIVRAAEWTPELQRVKAWTEHLQLLWWACVKRREKHEALSTIMCCKCYTIHSECLRSSTEASWAADSEDGEDGVLFK